MHTDDSGNILWSYLFGGAGDELIPRIRETSEGGYPGTSATTAFVADTMNNIYLIKMDASGNSACYSTTHSFNEIDTTLTETALSLTVGSGVVTNTLACTAMPAPFVPDTLCQAIVVALDTEKLFDEQPIIFPSPAGNTLFVDAPEGLKEITIYTALGTRLMSVETTNRISSLDISEFPSGIYLVQVACQSETWTRRLVVE